MSTEFVLFRTAGTNEPEPILINPAHVRTVRQSGSAQVTLVMDDGEGGGYQNVEGNLKSVWEKLTGKVSTVEAPSRSQHRGHRWDLLRVDASVRATGRVALLGAATTMAIACPSSDDLRHIAGFQKGGSGSSVTEIMRHVVDAASDGWRLSGA